MQTKTKNKFCKLKNLRNESDVEQNFVVPLLDELGYTADYRESKEIVPIVEIGKGRKRRGYFPDFVCYTDKIHRRPVLIIDAKHPDEEAEKGISDSQFYTSIIRRKLEPPKPTQYCIGTNGLNLIVKHHDSDKIEFELSFAEFQDENAKFSKLKEKLSLKTLNKLPKSVSGVFGFTKPKNGAIQSIFETCHKLIWKTEKRSPSSAFYEFAKLMFIKLNEDKKLREKKHLRAKIEVAEPLPKDEIIFSRHWIEYEERTDPNPINTILFKNLRKELEEQITVRKKKRIFESNEQIDLEPSTIKEVVKLIEHYDLYGIDEDLNGRLFETFLSATMRGKELGQFFTPIPVAKFMTQLADLKANKNHVDKVLDACCGTGGFLIEAMTDMATKIEKNRNLTNVEKEKLLEKLKNESLYGIDAGKSPPVARIARINMFIHRDGGSQIYFADSLNKDMVIDVSLDEELRRDRQELKDKILNDLKFEIVLTNPPFAMRYEKDKPNEKKILEKYELAYKNEGTKKMRTSLRSAVMFIERYWDLLKPNGKLLTIMDESILNTTSNKPFRDYIRKKFIIKAVISLPRNTFVKAESTIKTSVLYLKKKSSEDETQPDVFMAISENVGHNDTGKETPKLNDLPKIFKKFKKFDSGR